MMDLAAAARLLDELRARPAETEWLDFKEAKHSFDIEELGKYVSALANEANLLERERGWLVLGVKDKRDAATGLRPVVGSTYKNGAVALNELKHLVAQGTSPSHGFVQVFEVPHVDCAPGARVLMFQIPPAPRGQPVAWKGHFYGRAGESLGALGSKFEAIRMQSAALDWTAHCVSDDWGLLSSKALERGRALYAKKHPRRADELLQWSSERFVTELRLSRQGALTRAAVLLFGRPESVSILGNVSPRLTWQLLTDQDEALDYQHLSLPFVLSVDELVAKIRIHTVRILPPGQLAPLEVPNYDDWVIREALLNCVAHQDYALGGRVQVKESPASLLFSNAGGFIPGSIEKVLDASHATHLYRNPCLADAMVELGLIDTIGSGIKRMYRTQRDRHFPLPDFEIGQTPPVVSVRIYGREIDPAFTRALLLASHLSLADVIALDHVQKRRPIDAKILADLRRRKLLEGRSPAVHIAASVADATNQRGQYSRLAGLQKPALKQLVIGLIDRFGKATREDIEQALLEAMPVGLTAQQKANRVKNLLSEMSNKDRTIVANRRGVGAVWTRSPPLSKD
jgi:ATP-dependent DNA helicase RecG